MVVVGGGAERHIECGWGGVQGVGGRLEDHPHQALEGSLQQKQISGLLVLLDLPVCIGGGGGGSGCVCVGGVGGWGGGHRGLLSGQDRRNA